MTRLEITGADGTPGGAVTNALGALSPEPLTAVAMNAYCIPSIRGATIRGDETPVSVDPVVVVMVLPTRYHSVRI